MHYFISIICDRGRCRFLLTGTPTFVRTKVLESSNSNKDRKK